MFLAPFLSSRSPNGRAALVALLALLCLTVPIAPVAAADIAEPALTAAAPLAFMNDILGNRTRMIQIACVIGAVGIFFLTRSYR